MTTLYVRDLFGDYAPAQPERIIAEVKWRLALTFKGKSVDLAVYDEGMELFWPSITLSDTIFL